MIHKIALTMAVTLTPIAELRGSIPFGILYLGLNPLLTFFIAIIGNALLFFPIFFALRLLYNKFLSRFQIFNHYLDNVKERGKPKVDKYGFLGLALFTGIPLPATGVYTATMLSWLLGMNWKKAFAAIGLGVVIAGVIVLLITLGIIKVWEIFTVV